KPGVAAWDDLGIAEVGCQIETSRAECMARLRAEACRMGGDILYDMPKKARRPYEQAIVYRARVAHTRVLDAKPEKDEATKDAELRRPATEEESAGRVIPLGTPAPGSAEAPPADAGARPAADAGAPEPPPSRFF